MLALLGHNKKLKPNSGSFVAARRWFKQNLPFIVGYKH